MSKNVLFSATCFFYLDFYVEINKFTNVSCKDGFSDALGHFYREMGVEKCPGGVTIRFYFSTWHPCLFHVFEKLPCITSKNYYLLKEKTFTDFVPDFPEGERWACCWPAWHQCMKHAL